MEIKELSAEEFWPLFKQHRSELFSDTLYFNTRDVRTSHEIAQHEFLQNSFKNRFELHLVIFDGDELVGWNYSAQISGTELYMMNSAILPKYRRQGHYKRLMLEVLRRAQELGFQEVTSEHLASNNDILIPKLQAGFNILGTQVSDQFGVLVKLVYYLNPMRKDMYLFRTGAKHLTPEMRAVFHPPK